jgi:type II secretory pathway pseudopilin PulG
MSHSSKSFTLIEVVVVMGVMGLIMGGILTTMRQVIEGETLLKKMQTVEEETRFIMDAFTQDAEYSELDEGYKPNQDELDIFANTVKFNIVEKKSELGTTGALESKYTYAKSGNDYYIKRVLTRGNDVVNTTLNNTPLQDKPVYRVRLIETPDGSANYFITISYIYRVMIKNEEVLIPVETSAMSRTFVF